jgi:DNA-binding PadR family transcriptional regulator
MTSSGLRGSSDRSILVLTSLAGGPKHGYALIQDIEQISGVTFGAGTLYGCLANLERSGLIEPLPADDRRRPYRITQAGQELLRQRLEASQRVAAIGLARIDGAVT